MAPAVPRNFPRFPNFLCFSSLGSESVRVKICSSGRKKNELFGREIARLLLQNLSALNLEVEINKNLNLFLQHFLDVKNTPFMVVPVVIF